MEACIVRWRGPLIGFLAGRGLDTRTAIEVAEESFAEAWVGRDRFAGDPSDERAVGAWLRGIAMNRARVAFRSSRRHDSLPQGLEPEDCPGGGSGSDYGALLRAEVDRLPERERGAILAYYFGEATTSQVAVLLGTSERAVEGLLHRARKRLAGRPSVQSQERGRSTAVRAGDQHQP